MSVFTVIGRRWFDKVNGNTYHSVEVYRDGEFVDRVRCVYGYGEQYDQTALQIIEKYFPRIVAAANRKAGYKFPYSIPYASSLRHYSPHKVVTTVTDVARKKDL